VDFSLDPETVALKARIRSFIETNVHAVESDRANWDEHENIRLDVLEGLRAKAKHEGLWCIQMPKSRGGLGMSFVAMASCYEEMNRSLFGPCIFNSSAPDDGNMMVLERVANEAQKEKWLQPIVDGKVRSAFAMTEPAPGSGSDPTMMRTRATRDGDDWVIEGRKWFITGAAEAAHFILMARTSDDPRRGLTAFLFHKNAPGWRIERRIGIMGPEEHGGHCELAFEGLRIPDSDRLMEVGDGLRLTQIRLGPARLTHCMRWGGLARRALEVASEYVRHRESQGHTLDTRESVQWMLGEAAMRVEMGRLLTMRAAWLLDQGDKAQKEISMAKVVVSEALHHAVDTAIQLCGARGYSRDTVLEWIYRYARQARLVDGASEVHKMVLARHVLADGPKFFDGGR
jgi:acyl-CoA dehydrogenase